MDTSRQRTQQPPPSIVPSPSAEDLRKIVQDGDAQLTNQQAEKIGQWLAEHLSSSQIRNIFTTARQIEASWPIRPGDEGRLTAEERQRIEDGARRAARQLLLLKPKLAYQTSREQRGGTGMRVLADVLSAAIDLVGDKREYFQHFMDFFEAILAYHAAAAKMDVIRR